MAANDETSMNHKALAGYSQAYAITITLHPKIRDIDTVAQYDTMRYVVRDHIRDMYKKSFPRAKHMPLISLTCELTKSNDIHYHGILRMPMNIDDRIRDIPIWVRNVFRGKPNYNAIKKDLTKFLGFVVIKVIEDEPGWIKYITKTLTEFYKRTDRDPVIIDELNIIPQEYILKQYASC